MSWNVVENFNRQLINNTTGAPLSGAYLKAYTAGATPGSGTAVTMSTSASGTPTTTQFITNASGRWTVSNVVQRVFVDRSVKLVVYPNQTDADAHDTSNAIDIIDNLNGMGFGTTKVVDTKAELTALDASVYQFGIALGLNTKGDRQHFPAYFNLGESTTPTEFIFADDLNTGRWHKLLENAVRRPEAYGAVGDGVTNDATAIQTMLNTGPGTYVFESTYLVSSVITVPTDRKLVGLDGAKFLFTSECFQLVGDITSYPSSTTFISNVEFHNLTFDNTDTFPTTRSVAISAKSFEDLTVFNCHAIECHLIECDVKHDTLDKTVLDPMGTYGIDADAAMNKRLKVLFCTSYVATQQTSGEYSILPNFVVDATIMGNTCDGTGIAANAVGASETVGGDFTYYRMHREQKYIGNTIKRARAGIFIGLGDRCTIEANTINDMFDVGVDFESCKNCVAKANTFYNCSNGALATFFLNHGNIFAGNTVIVNKTLDAESFVNIALIGGSNYTFNANAEATTLLVHNNTFEYYDTSPSLTTKQLRVNVVPQNSLVTFKNNICRNVVIRTSSTGSTVKTNIIENEWIFETPPTDPVIYCRPVGSFKLRDAQLGWRVEGNEIMLAEGSASGTVAIECVFDESDAGRPIDVYVINNKIYDFETSLKLSGTLVRPNETGVIVRHNYMDGLFENAHNVLGPSIFWGFNYDREGRPYNTGNEVQDYGYMREACHYAIQTVAPSAYSQRIITKKGFNNTDGARANSTTYAVGDRVNPVADSTKVWLCLVGGQSDTSEPAAGVGDFTDNEVTWREFDNVTIKGTGLVET